jgi:hypothetical protein
MLIILGYRRNEKDVLDLLTLLAVRITAEVGQSVDWHFLEGVARNN